MTRRWLWVAVGAVAVANAVALSFNAPRGDDVAYLAWGVERLDTAWSPTLRPPPFPGWRPVTATWWWLGCGLSSVSGTAQQAMLAILWLLALAAFGAWARVNCGDRAALWVLGLALATDRFRDLVTWRSWLTTTSELALGGLALWALARGWRTTACGLAVLAVWSKEPAVLWLGAAAWVFHRDWRVPAACLVAGLPAAWRFAAHFAVADPHVADAPHRLGFYGLELTRLGWPLVALGILTWRRDHRPLWVFASALVLPLLYPMANATYLVEGLLLLGVATARHATGWSAVGLGLAAAIGMVFGAPGSVGNALYQASRSAALEAQWQAVVTSSPTSYALEENASDEARWLALRLEWELDAALATVPPSWEPVPGLRVQPRDSASPAPVAPAP